MASSSSRSNDSMVGLASSAAKIVVTTALLAGHKQRRRTRVKRTPFPDDSSVKSLVAIDEGEELVDFDFSTRNSRHPRVPVTRSRSPSPEPRSSSPSHPIKEIVLNAENNRSESPKSVTESDINDAITQVKARRTRELSTVSTNYMSDSDTSRNTAVSAASTGPEHVEFYLPQLGKDQNGKILFDTTVDDPTALVHILRPWQVDFFESLGIVTAKQFLKVKKRRNLARDMRKWRKQQGLTHIKSKSCKVALHIWAYTCESVLRDVKKQRKAGNKHVVKPEFLRRNLSAASLTTEATVPSSDESVVSNLSVASRTLVY